MGNTKDKPIVLVVDDVPENLMVLGELLHDDYRIRVANSGLRALEVAASEPRPDIILLDVMMPDLDGYGVLERLRTMPETSGIPVIFVTAADSEADEERGLALGAVDFIHKPVKPAIVRARVRTHLDLKAARDSLQTRNLNLETEVVRRIRENQMIQDVSMRALASLAETRDNETGNHIRRTQHYVELLAQELIDHARFAGLQADGIIDIIVKAAPLHDIGKVGIPDHILLKPGPLEPEEWRIMQTHTRLGADAIEAALIDEDDQAPLAFLHVAMDIAYSHHEKWDGSGYPDRLRGDAIPLPARLMAVADVFDALISRRVYKPPMPFEQAAAIIREGRGAHFDPDIVDAFVRRFDDFVAIARRYTDD
ncbi:MAG: two-component system response regulator [Rhodocyclaceae bacterium]|jgi:putative two-component system response regulator|nr:two-component system response regulator [Rhodocyclaceae bacterium]